MQDRLDRWLINTDTLSRQMDEPKLQVIDCSTRLAPDPEHTFRVEACIDAWRDAHIPGATYADLQGQLSEPDAKLRFTMPSPERFERGMRALGVSNDSRVVLYSRHHPMWATRIWWMLRAFGFDNAAVLDGGIDKWEAEGRPVMSGDETVDAGDFTAKRRVDLIATREDVLGAVTDGGAVLLNALSREQHVGGGTSYGRPGRIAHSEVLPAREMVDPETKTFLPIPRLKALLDKVGADGDGKLITYCGGGIAATTPAFVMALLGRDDVAVYDNSLSEWSNDPDLPMQTG